MTAAIAVFEGGGARGIAPVGGLRAAEGHGLRWEAVAGTSAGAIVAALVAAGYTAERIFDPDRAEPPRHVVERVLRCRVIDLFDPRWDPFRRLLGAPTRLGRVAPWSAWCPAALLPLATWLPLCLSVAVRHGGGVARALSRRGWFSAEAMIPRFDAILRDSGSVRPGHGGLVTFDDLPLPLSIVATDIERGEPLVFDRHNHPDFPVARAVAASIAVPGVMRPVEAEIQGTDGRRRRLRLLDGGMVSNLPAWLFEDERYRNPDIPTLAFTLADEPGRLDTLRELAGAVARTAIFGGQGVALRGVDNLIEVRLPTPGLDLLKFDATLDEARRAHKAAHDAALRVLNEELVGRQAQIAAVMGAMLSRLRDDIGHPGARLRAAIAVRSSRELLRFRFHVNMTRDPDRRLVLPLETTAAGLVWRERDAVAWDRAAGRLQVGQKQIVMPLEPAPSAALQTILSVPIFAEAGVLARPPRQRPDPVAVLAVDADRSFWNLCQDPDFLAEMVKAGGELSNRLRGLRGWRRFDGFDE
jgi:NTE family protein